MTLAISYSDDLSRVILEISSAPAAAEYAFVDRSVDQITWNRVRGGNTVALDAGVGRLDDYEFQPGVVNYYRVSYVDSAQIELVSNGAVQVGNNVSLNPPIGGATSQYDLMLLFAAIERTTATPNVPAGWTDLVSLGNVRVMGKIYAPGDIAPTVTFTGGSAGDATQAFIRTVRNGRLGVVTANGNTNASAVPVAYPGVNYGVAANTLSVLFAWKQVGNSSFTPGSTWANGYGTSDATNGQSVRTWHLPSYPLTVSSGSIADTAAAAVSKGVVFGVPKAAYIHRESTSITPEIDGVWIKNTQRPYMNRKVIPIWPAQDTIDRRARAGVFDVIGRTVPIAVADTHGSREWTMVLTTISPDIAADFDACFRAGEVVLVQTPPGCRIEGMYCQIGNYKRYRKRPFSDRRYFDMAMVEVAAPDSEIVAATVLYADILAEFATYADLLAAEPTYSDVLFRIGDPTDIITG